MSSTDPSLPLKPLHARRKFATPRAIVALLLREMATTYGRSPGGYIWAVLEPAAGIALLTAIFSLGFRSPPIGSNFPIFYATGLVPFLAFIDVTNKTAASVTFSKPLLAYPSVTFFDAIAGRFLVNGITQLMVAFIILVGILMLFETRTVPDYPQIITGFVMLAALSLGMGTMNCFLQTMFPVYQRIWSILTRPLLLLSCVFYMFDTIPAQFQTYLWFNPLVHVVGQMRKGFYPSYDATYVNPTFVFITSLVSLLIGLVFLLRYKRDLINY